MPYIPRLHLYTESFLYVSYWHYIVWFSHIWIVNKKPLPKVLEVVIIERLGNAFNGEGLSVGKEIWTKQFPVVKKELLEMQKYVQKTTEQISDYYKVFKKLNQN